MLIITGTLLVLATWAFLALCFVLLGLAPARLSSSTDRIDQTARRAMWFGVLITTITVYLLNLSMGLHSSGVLAAFFGLVCILGTTGIFLIRRQFIRIKGNKRPLQWLLTVALVAAVVYLAVAALGPVTNYDSGLYHLGAIHYASEFPTIPGLANLYFAFGYGNAAFPLAAFLGNGPWGDEGFRLLNGLIVSLAVLDLLIRLRQRKITAGTYILIVGIVVSLIPLVALSDYWVTSPSQDSTVMVVTVVSVAYLADAVAEKANWLANGAVALVLSIMLVLLRPTMVTFGLSVLVALIVLSVRRREGPTSARVGSATVVLVILAGLAGIAAVARDYVLSGWLQYPLSIHAFSVPWLAADPTQARLATLGYHRDPSDLWNAATGWQWISAWISRLPTQWETYEFALLAIVALVTLISAKIFARHTMRWRGLLLVLVPSVVAVLTWFLASPPSFRFIWGPLFMIPASIIGWGLWRIIENRKSTLSSRASWIQVILISASLPILLVVVFSAVARLDTGSMSVKHEWSLGFSIPYAAAQVEQAPTKDLALSGGLTVKIPTLSDQCWGTYPLCTPDPAAGLALRGTSLQDGFLP